MAEELTLTEKRNYRNILAKLQSGKTLTTAESKLAENYERKEAGLRPKKTEAELADEFGVDRRGSIVRWKKLNAPLEGTDAQMYQWLIEKKIRGAADWKRQYRLANPEQFPIKAKKKKTAKKKEPTKTPEELRDEYFEEVQHAKSAQDEAREKIALDGYLKITDQIRKNEAHDKRLGLDRGEVLPRSEVERIIKNATWAGNACCYKFSKQIAQRLANKPPGEVHKVLHPMLTGLLVFEGMKRLAKVPGEINLPQWVIDCYQTERQNYLKP